MTQGVMISLSAFKLRMVILKSWKGHTDFTKVKIGKFFKCHSKLLNANTLLKCDYNKIELSGEIQALNGEC